MGLEFQRRAPPPRNFDGHHDQPILSNEIFFSADKIKTCPVTLQLAVFFSLAWMPMVMSFSFFIEREGTEIYILKLHNAVIVTTVKDAHIFRISTTMKIYQLIINTPTVMLQLCAMMSSLLTIYNTIYNT